MEENKSGSWDRDSPDSSSSQTAQSSQPEIAHVRKGANCDGVADVDSLGFEPYVNGIAQFLTDETTETPLTISIEGEWGSGKTSFMKQLEKALDKQLQERGKKAITFWFSPWLHDKEESLWAAFALEFIESLRKRLIWRKRILAGLKLVRLRFDWTSGWLDVVRLVLSIGCAIALLAILAVLFFSDRLRNLSILGFTAVQTVWTLRTVGSLGVVSALLWLYKKSAALLGNPFAIDLRKHIKSPDYDNRVCFRKQFHDDFANVVESYVGIEPVYIFIDDLDRCEVPRAAELMQSITLMLNNHPHLVFILGMDREKVAAGLAQKFKELMPYLSKAASTDQAHLAGRGLYYGWDYIEKFLQLSFSVPQADVTDLDRFLDSLSVKETRESALRPSVRKMLGSRIRGWLPLSAKKRDIAGPAEVGVLIGAQALPQIPATTPVQAALLEHIRIELGKDSDIVRELTKEMVRFLSLNPRRIKQFINQFRLRAYLAYETGVFDEAEEVPLVSRWTLEKLAKFVLLGMRWPSLITDLQRSNFLLRDLQLISTDRASELSTMDPHQLLARWSPEIDLLDFLRFRCDLYPERYSLEAVPLEKMLKVSPLIVRSNPNSVETSLSSPQTAPQEPPSTVNESATQQGDQHEREALKTCRIHIDRFRELVRNSPSSSSQEIRENLDTLQNILADSGDRPWGLRAIWNAVDVCRRISRANPGAFERNFAVTLFSLTRPLRDLGDLAGAIAVTQEAVDIYRRLAETDPTGFGSYLAIGLSSLSPLLSNFGDLKGALAAVQEAVTVYRRLARANPAAHESNLAGSLINLAHLLSEFGEHAGALSAIREVVDIRRRLTLANPAASAQYLATSLIELSNRLSKLGDCKGALAAALEAVDIYRRLAQSNPAAFESDLAMSLNNLSNCLSDLGDNKGALAVVREAVSISRRLAQASPAASEPDLAMNLNNLSNRFNNLGDRDKALAAVQEAVNIRRRLAQVDPAANEPNLARSLSLMGNIFLALRMPREAIASYREVIELLRPYARQYPEGELAGLLRATESSLQKTENEFRNRQQ